MYPIDVDNATGRPIDAAWAAAHDRNERLVEIKQGKGQSETHPLLSPTDEFASYELYQTILGQPADVGRIDHITGSFGRQALKDGIAMQDVRGYNPYKLGMAGGSDGHNTGSPYRQDNFFGLHADADGSVERRFAGVLVGGTMDVRLENPGGLTGVWAEENTRPLWDAMYRKEISASAARTSRCALSADGLQQGHRERRRLRSNPTRSACRWAPTCRPCRRAERARP
jgi:hypothetical protein